LISYLSDVALQYFFASLPCRSHIRAEPKSRFQSWGLSFCNPPGVTFKYPHSACRGHHNSIAVFQNSLENKWVNVSPTSPFVFFPRPTFPRMGDPNLVSCCLPVTPYLVLPVVPTMEWSRINVFSSPTAALCYYAVPQILRPRLENFCTPLVCPMFKFIEAFRFPWPACEFTVFSSYPRFLSCQRLYCHFKPWTLWVFFTWILPPHVLSRFLPLFRLPCPWSFWRYSPRNFERDFLLKRSPAILFSLLKHLRTLPMPRRVALSAEEILASLHPGGCSNERSPDQLRSPPLFQVLKVAAFDGVSRSLLLVAATSSPDPSAGLRLPCSLLRPLWPSQDLRHSLGAPSRFFLFFAIRPPDLDGLKKVLLSLRSLTG